MGRPSARSDVFSAAMVLHRMLAGSLPGWPFEWPFAGNDRLRRKVSPQVIAFLRRALEMDARKRFSNAGTMLHAYRRIRSKERVKPKRRLARRTR